MENKSYCFWTVSLYKKRDYPYYRIYVKKYVIYYVVIDNVMEVRRLMYGAGDVDRHL